MPDYLPIRRLGSGAFGEVWLVEDRAFGEQRAVKFVPPGNIHNPTNFYHEPQALKALQHENVVAVSDAGTLPDGRLYIAMECLKGSVEDEFKGGIVPLRRAIEITQQVCRGLTYTHDSGYVHRDIKPANVLLCDNGNAKISDFGLCTNVIAPGAASAAGYILHIAPEVILEDSFTYSSDIYAVGLTLYRLINGDSLLPTANDLSEVQDMIVAGSYPDRNLFQPFVPRSVRQIVRKALSMDPADRYVSPRALRHALERVTVTCDWDEHVVPFGSCWTGTTDQPKWIVTAASNHRIHEITVERMAPSGKKWRLHSACCSNSKLNDHRRQLARIFENIGTKGHP